VISLSRLASSLRIFLDSMTISATRDTCSISDPFSRAISFASATRVTTWSLPRADVRIWAMRICFILDAVSKLCALCKRTERIDRYPRRHPRETEHERYSLVKNIGIAAILAILKCFILFCLLSLESSLNLNENGTSGL